MKLFLEGFHSGILEIILHAPAFRSDVESFGTFFGAENNFKFPFKPVFIQPVSEGNPYWYREIPCHL